MESNKKLILELQKAFAGELGAIEAYKFHRMASKDPRQRMNITVIIMEEQNHLWDVADMLHMLGAKPSKLRNFIVASIGQVLGVLCFVSGKRLANYGAMVLESVGKNKYEEIAKLAEESGRPLMTRALLEMSRAEEVHERYFKKVR